MVSFNALFRQRNNIGIIFALLYFEMKKITTLFLLVFILCQTSISFAQLDGSFGGNKEGTSTLGKISAPATEVKKPKNLDFKNNNGFKQAYNEQQKEYRKKLAEKKLENKGVISPALRRKMTLQKKAEQYNFGIPMVDKELGSFKTKSNNLRIRAYDFGTIDGDVISVYKNNILVIDGYKLTGNAKILTIPLDLGFNQIEIVAVNEGYYRPNTGSFTVFDDNDDVVISDMWNLAKGAKVKAMVIKEK